MHVTHEGETLTLESEQRSSEVQLHTESIPSTGEPAAVVHAGYRRCSDFDPGNNAGQDYIALKADQDTVVGVVADGVGQSFYGDLAGRRVAKFLAELLWTQRNRPPSDEELTTALIAEAKAFQNEVDAFVIPAHLTPLLQEALAQTRVKGSQAVFAAFILDIARGTTVIYQVGDVDAYLCRKDGSTELLQAPKRGRWSSGGQTDLLLRSDRFEGIRWILVQSDGATDAWANSVNHDGDMRAQFEELTRLRASVDDISVISVSRSGKASNRSLPPPASREEPATPTPPEAPETASAPATPATPATSSAPAAPAPAATPLSRPSKSVAVIPSKRWLGAAFAAGVLTSLAFVCAFHHARPKVLPSGALAPAAVQSPPVPAATTIVPLSVTTSEYGELKKKAGTVQPTVPGEVSLWAAVPRRLDAALFRLQTPGLTMTVSPIAQDNAQRLFRVVLAHLPAGAPLPAEAELLDATGAVIARGKLTLISRDVNPPTHRGYYLLEPVRRK